jgi:uncharacterized protein YjbI with pentapeptide repeats
MNQQNKQPENQKERRFDPELLKKGLRCDLDQYEMLECCLEKEEITEWNKWRLNNPTQDILLEGAELSFFYLRNASFNQPSHDKNKSEKSKITSTVSFKEANFTSANLTNARLTGANLEKACLVEAHFNGASLRGTQLKGVIAWSAHFENADLRDADFEGADIQGAYIQGTCINNTSLKGANCHIVHVDGSTIIWKPKINRYSKKNKFTNFSGVYLDTIRIDPSTKQLLEYNVRRMNWEEWYKEHSFLKFLVKPFWWISDYGISTKRIIFTFFGLAFVFALLYRLFPDFVMVYGQAGDIRGFWHALYFSVVTMTTLGFGDIAANPDSWAGQTLLMIQVILGYVLLGALVTRFAVLFTAGGPAGKFADEKGEKDGRKSRSSY